MTTTTGTDGTAVTITDLAAWVAAQPSSWREGAGRYAALLTGVAAVVPDAAPEDFNAFTRRCLGVSTSAPLALEAQDLGPAEALATAMALGELISGNGPELGPGRYSEPPSWTETRVGADVFRHPQILRAAFPAGILGEVQVVIGVCTKSGGGNSLEAYVLTRSEDALAAREILDRLTARAAELNPYRGRVLRATYSLVSCCVGVSAQASPVPPVTAAPTPSATPSGPISAPTWPQVLGRLTTGADLAAGEAAWAMDQGS